MNMRNTCFHQNRMACVLQNMITFPPIAVCSIKNIPSPIRSCHVECIFVLCRITCCTRTYFADCWCDVEQAVPGLTWKSILSMLFHGVQSSTWRCHFEAIRALQSSEKTKQKTINKQKPTKLNQTCLWSLGATASLLMSEKPIFLFYFQITKSVEKWGLRNQPTS